MFYSMCVLSFQSFRLLRLSAELESRAASLRREGLQCLTLALAGTNSKGLWDMLMSFFGTEADKDDVWSYIDPKSKVARPLDLESTDGEEEEDDKVDEATASTSTAETPKVSIPRAPQVVRQDVCSLEEAIRVYPTDPKTLISTGIPPHLLVKREAKTSGASGASIYQCKHPECSPVFISKGGPAGLYSHLRRHHLGMCLVCPYHSDKLYWAAGGWKSHMEKLHPSVPWYRSQLYESEEQQAARMVVKATQNPTALSEEALRHDTAIQDSLEVKLEVPTEDVSEVKTEIPAEDMGGEFEEGEEGLLDEEEDVSDSVLEEKEEPTTDQTISTQAETQDEPETEDIDFPEETSVTHLRRVAPTPQYMYASRAVPPGAPTPPGGVEIRYRIGDWDESLEEETDPPTKRPRLDPPPE